MAAIRAEVIALLILSISVAGCLKNPAIEARGIASHRESCSRFQYIRPQYREEAVQVGELIRRERDSGVPDWQSGVRIERRDQFSNYTEPFERPFNRRRPQSESGERLIVEEYVVAVYNQPKFILRNLRYEGPPRFAIMAEGHLTRECFQYFSGSILDSLASGAYLEPARHLTDENASSTAPVSAS